MNIDDLAPLQAGPRFDPAANLTIKSILSDIDDTLVTRNTADLPSEVFIKTITEVMQTGVQFAFVSARPLQKVQHIIDAVQPNGLSILSNGAQVYNGATKQMELELTIPPDAALTIIQRLQANRIEHWVQDDGLDHFWQGADSDNPSNLGAYLKQRNIWQDLSPDNQEVVTEYIPYKPFVIVAHHLPKKDVDAVLTLAEEFADQDVVSFVANENNEADGSTTYDIFFIHRLANKRDGLLYVAKQSGISPEQTLAIGDGPNDVVILEFAGVSGVVGNGVHDALAAATVIGPTCADDGAHVIIETLLLADHHRSAA